MAETPRHLDFCLTHKATGRGIQWDEERIGLDRCRDANASMLFGRSNPDPCVFVNVKLRYWKPDSGPPEVRAP